jgi:hypothetical protein
MAFYPYPREKVTRNREEEDVATLKIFITCRFASNNEFTVVLVVVQVVVVGGIVEDEVEVDVEVDGVDEVEVQGVVV